jgi:hypothetical protein
LFSKIITAKKTTSKTVRIETEHVFRQDSAALSTRSWLEGSI